MRYAPPNCVDCGRFVGPDGNPDVVLTDEGWEAGYAQCGKHWRETLHYREANQAKRRAEEALQNVPF